MHASPAFHVIVRRYGIWRAVVIALVAMTAAVLIAWLVSRDEFTPLALRASVAGVGVGLIIAAAQLTRIDAMSLRWDTQCWHLGPASTAGDEPSTGQLVVAIDLGGGKADSVLPDDEQTNALVAGPATRPRTRVACAALCGILRATRPGSRRWFDCRDQPEFQQ